MFSRMTVLHVSTRSQRVLGAFSMRWRQLRRRGNAPSLRGAVRSHVRRVEPRINESDAGSSRLGRFQSGANDPDPPRCVVVVNSSDSSRRHHPPTWSPDHPPTWSPDESESDQVRIEYNRNWSSGASSVRRIAASTIRSMSSAATGKFYKDLTSRRSRTRRQRQTAHINPTRIAPNPSSTARMRAVRCARSRDSNRCRIRALDACVTWRHEQAHRRRPHRGATAVPRRSHPR